MDARDYIYNALHESMYAVKDDFKELETYKDIDSDDYFGDYIVEDNNGERVLSEVAYEYVADKVVCTEDEVIEMFDEIRHDVFESIIYDILYSAETREQIISLLEFALEEGDDSELAEIVMDDNFVSEVKESLKKFGGLEGDFIFLTEDDFDDIENPDDTPKNKNLNLRFKQTCNGGYSDEEGISIELYNYAGHYLNCDPKALLGCTHVFVDDIRGEENEVIYGYIEEK